MAAYPNNKAKKLDNGGKNPLQLAAARRLARVKNAEGVDNTLQQRPIGPSNNKNPMQSKGFMPGN